MQSLWMLLASAMFAVMGACVKIASDYGASLPLVILFRGIPSVLLIFVWTRLSSRTLRPASWKLHLWRNVAGVSSMWLGFYAISNLPLSTAVSLNYTAPLFIAAWMLGWGGTQRDPVRILTVLVGFLGVLAILRPSIGHDHLLAAFTGLMAGALGAVAMMQIRQLGRSGESEWRTVFIFSCCVVLTSLVALGLEGWSGVSWQAWLALVGVGLAGLVGQLAMTRAFGMGSALLTAALQYTTIIFAAVLGIVFWGDVPDLFAWGGIALIIAAGLLSVWRTYSEDRIMQGQTAPSNPQRSPYVSDLLIDAQSLQGVLNNPDWYVFDVRYSLADPEAGRRQYLEGHIPGAGFLDQGGQLAGDCTGSNGRHPLPDRQVLWQHLQACGVTPDSNIVVYDDNDASFAARAWWVLRWLGCKQVKVLDGGWQAWRSANGPVQTGPDGERGTPEKPAMPEHATGAAPELANAEPAMPTVTANDILADIAAKSRVVVDARTPERYQGVIEPIDPVAGRIPGALNRPIASNVQADGRFKAASVLRDEFLEFLGAHSGEHVVHYCGSGITACHNVFAMEVAGLGGAALYPGSWSEWCSAADRPVATG